MIYLIVLLLLLHLSYYYDICGRAKHREEWYYVVLFILILIAGLRRHYKFIGFSWRHFEQPFLRSTFEQAWSEEPEMLQSSCSRFRSEITLFPYFFRYWQFATNMFYPTKLYKTRYFHLRISKLDDVERVLNDQKTISICLNDTANCPDEEYEEINNRLQIMLRKKFDTKSSFEI